MSVTFRPKLKTLPAPQRKLWTELSDVPPEFVLYGGTALALQLGHRESFDFDFFGNTEFDPDQLLERISFLDQATVIQKSSSTLTAIIDRDGTVQVSFFGVPKLVRICSPLVVDQPNLKVATMLDLSGTKAAVVQKRAEAKDYIDLDAIFQHADIDLSLALSAAQLIYGRQFSPELTLKALSFFGDGNLRLVSEETQLRLVDAVKHVDLDKLPNIPTEGQNLRSENGQ